MPLGSNGLIVCSCMVYSLHHKIKINCCFLLAYCCIYCHPGLLSQTWSEGGLLWGLLEAAREVQFQKKKKKKFFQIKKKVLIKEFYQNKRGIKTRHKIINNLSIWICIWMWIPSEIYLGKGFNFGYKKGLASTGCRWSRLSRILKINSFGRKKNLQMDLENLQYKVIVNWTSA